MTENANTMLLPILNSHLQIKQVIIKLFTFPYVKHFNLRFRKNFTIKTKIQSCLVIFYSGNHKVNKN